jgi:hypothetical protein
MLEEVISNFLGGQDFVPRYLQPEMSLALRVINGEHGRGWPGVCRWCLQMARQAGGRLSDHLLFDLNDLLVIQLDADVADFNYSDDNIDDPFPADQTLPFAEPCPPPAATTDRLRSLVLRWLGEDSPPARTVFCTPSKALETWILVGLFPDNLLVRRQNHIECRENPETVLRGMPKERRLISGSHKHKDKYLELAPEFAEHWALVTERCTEARRFEEDFRSTVGTLNIDE